MCVRPAFMELMFCWDHTGWVGVCALPLWNLCSAGIIGGGGVCVCGAAYAFVMSVSELTF